MPSMSSDPAFSDFDYIIVGSGAGGAPLAVRLVEQGCRVLVLEAGPDHLAGNGSAKEASLVPSFHGLSTEHRDMSWDFFVKHYEDPPTGADPKETAGKGILYPRSSGIGGCTVHNAMITIAGPDSDWDDLADFVGDESWRGSAMRAYFKKLEHNDYSPQPTDPPSSWSGRARDLVVWLFGLEPDHSSGRHGFNGWLHTSLTDISLGLKDKQLVGVLKAALWKALLSGLEGGWTLARRFLKGTFRSGLDPNHAKTQADSPEGVVLVPLAVCGPARPGQPNFVGTRGHRSSPREILMMTQAMPKYRDKLVISTDSLVTRIVFSSDPVPRAIGVHFQKGHNLYKAHKSPAANDGARSEAYVKAGGEVILSAGAFNTPQLLMLSGIGDVAHLTDVAAAANDAAACALHGADGKPFADGSGPRRVHVPGVGRNLQDRLEISVVSNMKKDFSLLDGATFSQPTGSQIDPPLEQWRQSGTGLYTSNGSVLGIFKRSNPDLDQPDLFIFGAPFEFRGYAPGYSVIKDHNKFTWVILKSHTRNSDGTVRLQSANPRDVPLINFHYFNEVSCPGKSEHDPDVQALVEGVKFVRGISDIATKWKRVVVGQEHPSTKAVPEPTDDAINAWIRREAWGHHACGTCRMGPDDEPYAVLDSRLRVRGVSGLRVVDACIFPKIPGYFVVANIYMASEKAADIILADRKHQRVDTVEYPHALRELEAAALKKRRKKTPGMAPNVTEGTRWASDVTGLALSGGGIRSATFALGVVQALAQFRWLRRVDVMSTVSGGGYIGSFLGRWFDRLRTDAAWGGEREPQRPAPDVIEGELNNPKSFALRWLRKHGNYIAPTGQGDGRLNTSIFVRNFLTVHFVVGLFLFIFFGAANLFRYGALDPLFATLGLAGIAAADFPLSRLLKSVLGVFFSPWFVVLDLVLLFLVLPRIVGYWIVSQDKHERFSVPPLLITFLTSGLLLIGSVRNGLNIPLLFLGIAPLTALISVELAWRRGRIREQAIGRGNIETQRLRTRNYLTYDLGFALAIAGGVAVFAIVDTTAHALHQVALAKNERYITAFVSLFAGLGMLAPAMRFIANLFTRDRRASPSTFSRIFKEQVSAGALAIVLGAIPLLSVSFIAHAAYGGGKAVYLGAGATLFAFIVSTIIALPKALVIINRSSLSQSYAARLARAYLGASNPQRNRAQGANITEVMAGDDVASMRDYQPCNAGGPLHLLNVVVNQTVDFTSQRGNRDRKGENLVVSPIGMSVGQQWHAAWGRADEPADARQGRKKPLPLEPLGHIAGLSHPLIDENGNAAKYAEMLSLRQWMAISGAAVGPGRGQTTQLGTALLFGLANLRTGYWWDSGIPEAARDGYPPLTALQRALYVFQSFFLAQMLILYEWVARFSGPWERFWFISDGGFFENTGGYELIRRRLPRIIICDASADPTYDMGDFADLMRKVRIDFNAYIEPIEPADLEGLGIPDTVIDHLGSLEDLKLPKDKNTSQKHAALFWVVYPDEPGVFSLLLYFKTTVTGDETPDVLHHRAMHPEFPHEGTIDQAFDEGQWEAYRALGNHIAGPFASRGDWFWSVPLRGPAH